MDGPRGRWLLLHGTPLTPQVWDGLAGESLSSTLHERSRRNACYRCGRHPV